MRNNWTETLVGAVVLLGAGAFFAYLLSVGNVVSGDGRYKVTARFGQVGSLKAGDDVRVAGVRVGQVDKVSLDPKTYFAITDLSLESKIVLPSDSTAKVTSDGLLGGALISIEPGGSDTNLKPGGQIENTQGAVDLFGLIGQFINKPAPAPATDLP